VIAGAAFPTTTSAVCKSFVSPRRPERRTAPKKIERWDITDINPTKGKFKRDKARVSAARRREKK
jgi:hypothetical protein